MHSSPRAPVPACWDRKWLLAVSVQQLVRGGVGVSFTEEGPWLVPPGCYFSRLSLPDPLPLPSSKDKGSPSSLPEAPFWSRAEGHSHRQAEHAGAGVGHSRGVRDMPKSPCSLHPQIQTCFSHHLPQDRTPLPCSSQSLHDPLAGLGTPFPSPFPVPRGQGFRCLQQRGLC